MTASVGLGTLHCRQPIGKSRPLAERAALASRPLWRSFLVAWALGRLFRLLHPFCHLCFQGVEVEAGAALHRWEIEEGLDFLSHYLLDEQKAPKLVLEPIEVLRCLTFLS